MVILLSLSQVKYIMTDFLSGKEKKTVEIRLLEDNEDYSMGTWTINFHYIEIFI